MGVPIKKLFAAFGSLFPELQARTDRYMRMDGHTLKIILRDGRVMVFRYRSDLKWSLQTYPAYLNE